jgi:signal transduction histidine kinase
MPIRAAVSDPELEFPWWLPWFSAAIPTLVGTLAVLKGRPDWPTGFAATLAALAVLPFVLDVLDSVVPFRLWLSPWLFVPIVVVPLTIMLVRPADLDLVPFIFVILCAEMATRLKTSGGLAVLFTCLGVMIGLEVAGIFNGSFIWVIGITFGWGGGFAVRQMMLMTTRLQDAQRGLAEKAASDERSRIAREVHDVIAHSMSVTMLHITAARMALERARSDAALEALREAEEQGRRSLNEIRQTVGLLGPDEGSTAPPMPTAADLPKLVSDFRAAGLDVKLSMNGDVPGLPATAGLNLYRIVQESLTNVVKHAPGAKAAVELDVTGDDILLSVRNGAGNGELRPGTAESGRGMRGISERAALLGGKVDVLVGDRGWTVSVVAPRPTE